MKANRKLSDPVWRETDEGLALTLIVTDAGLAAIGIEPEAPKEPAAQALGSLSGRSPRSPSPAKEPSRLW